MANHGGGDDMKSVKKRKTVRGVILRVDPEGDEIESVRAAIQPLDKLLANGPPIPPVVVKHTNESFEGPPRKSIFKSTFNTHDIMHAPVEKTIQMLDKILAGERLFTM